MTDKHATAVPEAESHEHAGEQDGQLSQCGPHTDATHQDGPVSPAPDKALPEPVAYAITFYGGIVTICLSNEIAQSELEKRNNKYPDDAKDRKIVPLFPQDVIDALRQRAEEQDAMLKSAGLYQGQLFEAIQRAEQAESLLTAERQKLATKGADEYYWIDLVERLRKRAEIRRKIREEKYDPSPDRIADLCDEAADEIESLHFKVAEELEKNKTLIRLSFPSGT